MLRKIKGGQNTQWLSFFTELCFVEMIQSKAKLIKYPGIAMVKAPPLEGKSVQSGGKNRMMHLCLLWNHIYVMISGTGSNELFCIPIGCRTARWT